MAAPRHEQLFALIISVWAGLFTWSIIGLTLTEPVGDGFTRGLNRFTLFLLWQFAAAVAAIIVYVAGRSYEPGSALRWISRVPLALAIAALLLLVGLVFFSVGRSPQG